MRAISGKRRGPLAVSMAHRVNHRSVWRGAIEETRDEAQVYWDTRKNGNEKLSQEISRLKTPPECALVSVWSRRHASPRRRRRRGPGTSSGARTTSESGCWKTTAARTKLGGSRMANEAITSDWRVLAKWHCKPTLVAVQVLTKDTRDTCACALANVACR